MAERHEYSDVDFHPETWSPRPGHWDVEIGPWDNGSVDNKNRKAIVPYPYGLTQEHIRMHEAHHVLLSPEDFDMEHVDAQKMMEEIRVDAHAFHRNIDTNYRMDLVPAPRPEDDFGIERNAALAIAQFASVAYRPDEMAKGKLTREYYIPPGVRAHLDKAWALITPEHTPVLEEIITSVWNNPIDAVVRAAYIRFDEVFTLPEGYSPSPLTNSGDSSIADKAETAVHTVPGSCGHRTQVQEWYEGKDGKLHEHKHGSEHQTALRANRDAEAAEETMKDRRHGWGKAPSLAMSGHRSYRGSDGERDKLILEASGKLRRHHIIKDHVAIERFVLTANKTFIAQASGGVFHRGEEIVEIGRAWTDRNIFRGRRDGGSIVIDVSGSMSWDWSKLRQCVIDMPGATIALYAGAYVRHDDEAFGYTKDEISKGINGKILIIAEKGRWADPETCMVAAQLNGGNEVDLEALDWLAKQRGPRIWLSDGYICGGLVDDFKHTQGMTKLRAHVAATCRQHKIVRTLSVDAAIEYMRSRGRPGIHGIVPWNGKLLAY